MEGEVSTLPAHRRGSNQRATKRHILALESPGVPSLAAHPASRSAACRASEPCGPAGEGVRGRGARMGGVECKSAGPGRQASRCRREWRPEAARRSFGAPPQTSRWRGERRAVAASGAPATGRRAIPDRPCARWLPLNHEQPAGQKCPSALEAQPIEPRSTIKSEGPTGQRRPWSLTGGLALTSAGRGIPKCAGCH